MNGPTAAVLAALGTRARAHSGFERPRFFDAGRSDDVDALAHLLESEPGVVVRDDLAIQVAELVHSRSPARKRDPRADGDTTAAFLGGRDRSTYGSWVYYPWRRTLVHLLAEPEFVELRAARNQLHVTPEEQQRLRKKTIGIVGLSVGYSMAVTLALEGVGGRFRLADFDRLELSNTNRVPGGVTSLGQNKAVLAAQAMFEVDPYLDIEVFTEGVHESNAEAFFDRGGRLDLLLEECDDLPMKLKLREAARQKRVCVMTETSQGGILDIERFDLTPERPAFHGLMGGVTAAELARLTAREKAPFVLRFLCGADRMSTTLAASLVEVERTLGGWPQLASAVALGGGVVTDAARRLLLGSLRRSGRFQVDPQAIVNDEATAALRDPVSLPEAKADLERDAPAADTSAAPDRLERWVAWAALAPSGGNRQPWSFEEVGDGNLVCRLHPRAAGSALDPDGVAARVACGAALANLALAAGRDGQRTEVRWAGDGDDPALLYTCRFTPDAALHPDELAGFVTLRCTNRRVLARTAVERGSLEALQREAQEAGGALLAHDEESVLNDAGALLGELERVRVFSEPLYREMMNELADEPGAARGISLDTLELSATDRAALDIVRRRDVVSLLRSLDRGQALVELVREPVRQAGALCLLHMNGTGPVAALRGGVALQRVWLRATALGLALQPVSAGLYMMAQLARTEGGLPEWERVELARRKEWFDRLFPIPEGHSGILMFRLFRGPAPSARSSRLPISAILKRPAGRNWKGPGPALGIY